MTDNTNNTIAEGFVIPVVHNAMKIIDAMMCDQINDTNFTEDNFDTFRQKFRDMMADIRSDSRYEQIDLRAIFPKFDILTTPLKDGPTLYEFYIANSRERVFLISEHRPEPDAADTHNTHVPGPWINEIMLNSARMIRDWNETKTRIEIADQEAYFQNQIIEEANQRRRMEFWARLV